MANPRVRFWPVLIVILLAVPGARAQVRYQLLLKGGHVIDPRNQVDAVMDVAIADGKIAAVRSGIDPAEAGTVVDVTGLYVTPASCFATPCRPSSKGSIPTRSRPISIPAA
jgi:dihydroorotase